MTLTIETYERIWEETNREYKNDKKRHKTRWNAIFERKVSEAIAKKRDCV